MRRWGLEREVKRPTPRHGDFPLPAVFPLTVPGLKDAATWFLDNFDAEHHFELYCHTGVLTPGINVGPAGESLGRKTRDARHSWHGVFSERDLKSVRGTLEVFTESRARPTGYEPWILLGRREAAAAHECLLRMTAGLGNIAAELDTVAGREGVAINLETYLRAGVKLLARLVGCHFWTVYLWRGEEILPTLVDVEGLWYPEAVFGLAHMSPSLSRKAREPSTCVNVFDHAEAPAQSASGFQRRERVARCWAVHLTVGADRAVIYLNWRCPGEHGPTEHTVKRVAYRVPPVLSTAIDDQLAWISEVYPSTLLADADEPDARSLDPTIRYLSGWLSERAQTLAVLETGDSEVSVNPSGVQTSVLDSLKPWLSESNRPGLPLDEEIADQLQDDLSRLAIRNILGERFGRDCGDDKPDIELMLMRDRDHLQLPAGALYDWLGNPVSHRGYVPIGRDAQDERGLLPPNSSLAAQAVAWATALLLEHIPPTARRSKKAPETALVRRVLSTKPHAAARSELAIPLFAGEVPLGAFSVEIPGSQALSRQHVHWFEAIGLLIGAVIDAASRPECESERALLRDVFRTGIPPDNEEELWRKFTAWVRERTSADLVHVAARGDGAGMLDRFGVLASNTYVDLLKKEIRGRRSMTYAQRLLDSGDPGRYEVAIRELIGAEEAGLTRQLLRGDIRDYQWDPGKGVPKRRWLVRPLAGGARGLAVSANRRVTPYAVVWLGWCDPAVARRHRHLKGVARLASVFAALHLLYRVEGLTARAT